MALHDAIGYKDWERAAMIVMERLSRPEKPQMDEKFMGFLPLHAAARHGAPAAIVELLLQEYCAGAAVPDDQQQRLPLHFAVSVDSGCGLEVVQMLLDAYPEAAVARDAKMQSPLHVAAAQCSPNSANVVRLLLKVAPDMAVAPDNCGCLAIHAAAGAGSTETIEQLLVAAPRSISEADATGKLPLHWAAMKESSPAAMRALLRAFPGAVRISDCRGQVPIHFVARGRTIAALQKASILLETCPASLHWANHNHESALERARKAGTRSSRMADLLGRWAVELNSVGNSRSAIEAARKRLVWAFSQRSALCPAGQIPPELTEAVTHGLDDTNMHGRNIAFRLQNEGFSSTAGMTGRAPKLSQSSTQDVPLLSAVGATSSIDIPSAILAARIRMGARQQQMAVQATRMNTDSGHGSHEGSSLVATGEDANCSCIFGNACVTPYGCLNWNNRFEVAMLARANRSRSS